KAKELNLGYTKVLAPINGRAQKVNITVGNLVAANPIDATVLTTIVTMQPMYAYFDVDEQTLLRIQRLVIEGKVQPRAQKAPTVYMGLADRTDYPFTGTIDFVGNQLDPSKGTIQVRAVFPNEDNALTPGLFARLRVPLGDAAPALLVTE